MAYCDYMHCAVCDDKVHYDAETNYDYGPYPVTLCRKCAETHEIIIRNITTQEIIKPNQN